MAYHFHTTRKKEFGWISGVVLTLTLVYMITICTTNGLEVKRLNFSDSLCETDGDQNELREGIRITRLKHRVYHTGRYRSLSSSVYYRLRSVVRENQKDLVIVVATGFFAVLGLAFCQIFRIMFKKCLFDTADAEKSFEVASTLVFDEKFGSKKTTEDTCLQDIDVQRLLDEFNSSGYITGSPAFKIRQLSKYSAGAEIAKNVAPLEDTESTYPYDTGTSNNSVVSNQSHLCTLTDEYTSTPKSSLLVSEKKSNGNASFSSLSTPQHHFYDKRETQTSMTTGAVTFASSVKTVTNVGSPVVVGFNVESTDSESRGNVLAKENNFSVSEAQLYNKLNEMKQFHDENRKEKVLRTKQTVLKDISKMTNVPLSKMHKNNQSPQNKKDSLEEMYQRFQSRRLTLNKLNSQIVAIKSRTEQSKLRESYWREKLYEASKNDHEQEQRKILAKLKLIQEYKRSIIKCTDKAMALRSQFCGRNSRHSGEPRCYDCRIGRHPADVAVRPALIMPFHDDIVMSEPGPILCRSDGFWPGCPIVKNINERYDALKMGQYVSLDLKLERISIMQKQLQWEMFNKRYLNNGLLKM
uniref:uncharacterized protein LOC120341195 n=1 Tax=Styela clava TaxID=7725 RepID=UPI00193AA9A6|nr:uncharacterized protein LOC120341195 [Styela clava]